MSRANDVSQRRSRKIGLEMRAELYKALSQIAEDNGRTRSYVLEKAVEHYIQFVAPAQDVVRPEIMAQVRRSVQKNRKLLQRLAK